MQGGQMDFIKVLVVDDEPIISEFIKARLSVEAPHFLITTVEGGAECIGYVSGHDVDCILSDFQMPLMNGMELLIRLKEQGFRIPFIFITAQGNEEVAREAFKQGASDYFTKEIGFAHFPRIINSVEQAVAQRKAKEAREKAEGVLKDEKTKLEVILEGIADGISIQDKDYRVLYQNSAHKAMVGEHRGDYCYRVYEMNDSVCESCPVAASFMDGKVHRAERVVPRDGGELHYELVASALRDEDGEIFAGIEVVRDVTERKNFERQRADFYAMVSHDLKSPLTAIIGYQDLIMERLKDTGDKDLLEMSKAVGRSSEKLLGMIDDFLAVSRHESGRLSLTKAPVDIGQLVREVAEEFGLSAKLAGQEINAEVAENLPRFILDRRLIERALGNLVQNAVNYTPRGGRVTIRVGREAMPGGEFLALSVTDTGPGIPVSEQTLVFEKYFRSSKDLGIRGTGLGLAIVKAVTDAHGGRLELESAEGVGSTFRMLLPPDYVK